MRACSACGGSFESILGTERLCRVCFAERNRDLDLALAEIAWREGYDLGQAVGLEGCLGSLPLRDLVALCHPDRHPHERFEVANDVTAWLLGVRDTIVTAA